MNEEALFAAALEKPTLAERLAFLEEACGGDVAMRQRVDRLLAAHEQAVGILDLSGHAMRARQLQLAADEQAAGILDHGPEGAPLQTTPGMASPPINGVFAGRFKLRQKLGEGGMGEVWVADQTEPVQRRVALKVVRPGLDSTRMLARFDQERQALALMEHPNIAKVLDAGVAEGRPYFVMELIKGVPITQYCDEAKLSPKERLALFVPVCQAVQHAHQKGVIHRDIKPSNILVALYDGKPVPKVIDFGIAKATGPKLTEQSIYTEIGSLIGTVEYMSPEQAELNNLDIDTRSDVYALGVVLYELLTGGVPFSRKELQQAAFTEMLRIIKEVEPPRPSTKLSGSGTLPSIAQARHTDPQKLITLMRGELDWIVLKCLEKDRGRRYQTANGLARDVERYLADEIVEARPPSAGYRVWKLLRRNKSKVAVTVALALSLLVGAAAVVTVQTRAQRERVAHQAWTTASIAAAVREAGDRAEEAWGLADYPDRMQRATDAAVAAIHRADDNAAGGAPTEATLADLAAARQAVDELTRHTRLTTTSIRNQQLFAQELSESDGTLKARKNLAERQGEALRQLGLDPIDGNPDEVARAVVASRLRDALLGVLLEWQLHVAYVAKGHNPGGDAHVADRLLEVIRSARQMSGGAYARWQEVVDRDDVPGLLAFAASPDALTFRSGLINQVARDLSDRNQPAASRTFLRAAVDHYPHDIWLHHDLYVACYSSKPPDYAEALRHVSAGLALRPDSSYFHYLLGAIYADLGSDDNAIAAYRKAIALGHYSGFAFMGVGELLLKKKDWDGAIPPLREAARLQPKSSYPHRCLAVAYREKKDWEGATAESREAIRRLVDFGNLHQAELENPHTNYRYRVAVGLVSILNGQGPNELPQTEQRACRKQAQELLAADLAALGKLVASERPFVQRTIQRWLGDTNLAAVRDATELKRFSPEERNAWDKLWTDVRVLCDRTAPQPVSASPPK
jgi:tetratricopeptide (TPR) repeat protein/tRNA A-37 threonylcarbamoyl transferase component Bud32